MFLFCGQSSQSPTSTGTFYFALTGTSHIAPTEARHDFPGPVKPDIITEPDGGIMASNRGVAYMGTGRVEIQAIDYPKLALGDRKCEHGVILKVVTTNI